MGLRPSPAAEKPARPNNSCLPPQFTRGIREPSPLPLQGPGFLPRDWPFVAWRVDLRIEGALLAVEMPQAGPRERTLVRSILPVFGPCRIRLSVPSRKSARPSPCWPTRPAFVPASGAPQPLHGFRTGREWPSCSPQPAGPSSEILPAPHSARWGLAERGQSAGSRSTNPAACALPRSCPCPGCASVRAARRTRPEPCCACRSAVVDQHVQADRDLVRGAVRTGILGCDRLPPRNGRGGWRERPRRRWFGPAGIGNWQYALLPGLRPAPERRFLPGAVCLADTERLLGQQRRGCARPIRKLTAALRRRASRPTRRRKGLAPRLAPPVAWMLALRGAGRHAPQPGSAFRLAGPESSLHARSGLRGRRTETAAAGGASGPKIDGARRELRSVHPGIQLPQAAGRACGQGRVYCGVWRVPLREDAHAGQESVSGSAGVGCP